MRMVLMTGCGISTLFPLEDQDACQYWVRRIVEHGDVPSVKIMDSNDLEFDKVPMWKLDMWSYKGA